MNEFTRPRKITQNIQHATKCGSGRIWTVTICRSLGSIYGSVITVGLRLGLELGLGLGFGLRLELRLLYTNCWRKWQNADKSRDYNWPMACHPADSPYPQCYRYHWAVYSGVHPRIYSLVITIKVSLVPNLRVGQSSSLAVMGTCVKIRGFQPQAP